MYLSHSHGSFLLAGSLDARSTFTSRRAGESVGWLLPLREISNCRITGDHSVILITVIASISEAIQCHHEQHLVSGCGSLGRARARRLLRWRKQQVGRNIKTGTQPLRHGHVQSPFPLQDFTDAARRSQDRHHVRTGETMLIHQVADEIRCAWWPTRPLAFLIGRDQTRLRLQPGNVGWLIRLPESFNKARARASSESLSIKIRVASITRSPRLFCRTRCGYRRSESLRLLPDIAGPQPNDSHCP